MSGANDRYGPLARGIERPLSEKGWLPARFYAIYFAAMLFADVLFYVVLTPVWLGLRAAGWAAEMKSRLMR